MNSAKDQGQLRRKIETLLRRSEQLQVQARDPQREADALTKQVKAIGKRQAERITARK